MLHYFFILTTFINSVKLIFLILYFRLENLFSPFSKEKSFIFPMFSFLKNFMGPVSSEKFSPAGGCHASQMKNMSMYMKAG